MKFELGSIENMEGEIISSEYRLNSSFDSEWDDDVHESFYDFVNAFESEAKSIIDLINSLAEILQPLEEVNGDDLNKEFDDLLSKIEGM